MKRAVQTVFTIRGGDKFIFPPGISSQRIIRTGTLQVHSVREERGGGGGGWGEQGWHSGESFRLSPVWPGFDSRT